MLVGNRVRRRATRDTAEDIAGVGTGGGEVGIGGRWMGGSGDWVVQVLCEIAFLLARAFARELGVISQEADQTSLEHFLSQATDKTNTKKSSFREC